MQTNSSVTPKLPDEVWKVVISNLPKADLKRTRFVNSTFSEFATPPLFESVSYSLIPENHTKSIALSKNEKLCQLVRRLYLHTSSYSPSWPTDAYTQVMSNNFADTIGVSRELFKEGPLSAASLLKVLRTDLSIPLGNNFLPPKLRALFVAGYSQHCARADFEFENWKSDGVYKTLSKLLPCFKQLSHVETVTSWTPVENRSEKFKAYLRQHLPPTTIKLIPGFQDAVEMNVDSDPKHNGLFDAPGVSARRLNFMSAEAQSALCYGQEAVHEMTLACLRALKHTKTQLDTLSLPGSDYLGQKPKPMDRTGIVTVPPLTAVTRQHDHGADFSCIHEQTMLLPLFQHLKRLELHIDAGHPGTRRMGHYHLDWSRLPKALQSMKAVESLSIGYVVLPEETQQDISLYETLLSRDTDYEDEGEYGGGHDVGSTTAGFQLLSTMFGIPPPPTPPTGMHNNLDSIFSGSPLAGHASSTPAFNIPVPGGTISMLPPQSISGAQPTPLNNASTPVNGLTGAATAAPSTVGSSTTTGAAMTTPEAQNFLQMFGLGPSGLQPSRLPTPEDPFPSNTWPKLKQLCLWNMPARPLDVLRLMKTISPTLRNLELNNVSFSGSRHADAEGGDSGTPTNDDSGFESSASSAHSSHVNRKDVAKNQDKWISILDFLGDILRLKSCNIILGDEDSECLYERLEDQIDGFENCTIDLDELVSAYLEDGDGMGFAMFVAAQTKQLMTEWDSDSRDEDKEDSDEEDKDGSADEGIAEGNDRSGDEDVEGEDEGTTGEGDQSDADLPGLVDF